MHSAIHFIAPATFAITNLVNAAYQSKNLPFLFLFAWRYLRLVVHIIAYLFIYKPDTVPLQPRYRRSDCTVIVPTVEPCNEDFKECLHSILMNSPAAILIVTVGRQNKRTCDSVVGEFQLCHPNTNLSVLTTEIASKRQQVCAAIPLVETKICVLADDHVFWPSLNFLPTALAPFEDPRVGCIGTNKKVRRTPTGFGLASFFNFLGCTYLERHNFELSATNSIDGGVFVVSGRTSIIRTTIVQDPAFMAGFTNEKFFFGKFGPLNADDDNFITRWVFANHWKIKFQHCKDATVETTLGTYPKFLSQCLRWARTTWRSNPASLFTDGTVWSSQPWCVYAVYLSSFFNFALLYDPALMYTLYYHTSFGASLGALGMMAAWIFASKMVKLIPHFWTHPADILFIPGYVLFAYYHSLLKLYALITFYVTAWGGRNLAAVSSESDSDSAPTIDAQVDQSYCSTLHTLPSHYHSHVSFKEQVPIMMDRTEDGYDSSDDSEPSSSTSSSSWVPSPSPSRLRGRNRIETPWGLVRRHDTVFQPANVLESQIPIPLKTLKKKTKKHNSTSSSTSSTIASSTESSHSDLNSPRPGSPTRPFWGPQPNQSSGCQRRAARRPGTPSRPWNRGVDCGRQHDGNGMLDHRGRCNILDVREVQWTGR